MNNQQYINIINNQNLIKFRLNQQSQNILWSYPYLNLSNYFPFYKGDKLLNDKNIIIKINLFYFIQEQEQDNIVNVYLWNPISKTKTLLMQFTSLNNKYFLYNLPKHFGVIIRNNNDDCYLNEQTSYTLLKDTILYKQTDSKNEINWDNYLILNNFNVKNYKSTITSDHKLKLIYDSWYGDCIKNNQNKYQREFLFELISNPVYCCQRDCVEEKEQDKNSIMLSIPYTDIKNYYYRINNESATYYMHNMPKQECFLNNDGQEIFIDYCKEEDQEYNVWQNTGDFQYRTNTVNYNIFNNIKGLKLRIY